jgi:hypothetical protein
MERESVERELSALLERTLRLEDEVNSFIRPRND